jgi:hypothetical protein
MFCPKCGKPIDDDASFCRYCGSKVSADSISRDGAVNNILGGNTSDKKINIIKTFKFNVDFFIKYSTLIISFIMVASVLKGLLPQSNFDNLHISNNISSYETYSPTNDNNTSDVDNYESEDEQKNADVDINDDMDESTQEDANVSELTQDDGVIDELTEEEKQFLVKHFIDCIFNLYSKEEKGIKLTEFIKISTQNIYDYYLTILAKYPDETKKNNKSTTNIDLLKYELSKMKGKELKDNIFNYAQEYIIYSNVRKEEPEYDDGSLFDVFLDITFGVGAEYRFDPSFSTNGTINPQENFHFAIAFPNIKLIKMNHADEVESVFFDNASLFLPCPKDDTGNWESLNKKIFKSIKGYSGQEGNVISMSRNGVFLWLESITPSDESVCEIKISREH